MIKFSKEKVLLLHQLIAEETGGSIGVRDEGLLEENDYIILERKRDFNDRERAVLAQHRGKGI